MLRLTHQLLTATVASSLPLSAVPLPKPPESPPLLRLQVEISNWMLNYNVSLSNSREVCGSIFFNGSIDEAWLGSHTV